MANFHFNANLNRSDARRAASWQNVAVNSINADTLFEVAADHWLQFLSPKEDIASLPIARRPIARRIRPTTAHSYMQFIGNLKLFFGGMTLGEIRLDHIRGYEDARVAGSEPFVRKRRPNKNAPIAPCPASPSKANAEVHVLKRILRGAKLWGFEQDELHTKLPVEEKEIPRALSRRDQMLWLKVAASEPRWDVVYWYSVLAFATCMSTNEIRALRIGDINLEACIINIPWEGSKNLYRHRTVSIGMPGDPSYQAVEWLLDRARRLGSRDVKHYLFPFRRRDHTWVSGKPMTVNGIRGPWDEVRKATGLKTFRPYDTRHTAITRLAEENIPIAMIMDMAGHISPRMTKHYTHISDELKTKAMRQVHRSIWNGTPVTDLEQIPTSSITPFPMPRPTQQEASSALRGEQPALIPPGVPPQSSTGVSSNRSYSSFIFASQFDHTV